MKQIIKKITFTTEHLKQVLLGRFSINDDTEKAILVIIEPPAIGIGDLIICLDVLYNLSMVLPKDFKLYIAAPQNAINFLKSIKLDSEMNFLEIEYNNKFNQHVWQDNREKLRLHWWKCVFSLRRCSDYMKLLLDVRYIGSIIEMDMHEWRHSNLTKIIDYCFPMLNTNYYSPTTFYGEIYENQFYHLIEDVLHIDKPKHYSKYAIPPLCNNLLPSKTYCILCPAIGPGKIWNHRKWPLKRFVQIAQTIIASSHLSICLCGTNADKKLNTKLKSFFTNDSRMIDLTGKTSFQEWIELIRGAAFVFGNDSGYIHLAAHLGTPSIAIAGYWNYGRFLPYPKEYEKRGYARPIDIRIPDAPCHGCDGEPCKLRKQCDTLVEEKDIYKCVYDITTKQAQQILIDHHFFRKR